MEITLLTIIMGITIGIIDIIPMRIQNINNYYIFSAFLFHLVMPSIVNNVFLQVVWWQSAILYFVLTLPLAIIILKDDKKDSMIMIVTSIVVGCLVGLILS